MSSAFSQSLSIFAASSLTEVFNVLAEEFEQSSGVELKLNFAGSSTLRTQIIQGAAVDIFASADPRQFQALKDAGLLMAQPELFASNKLAVITPKNSNLHTLQDLTQNKLFLVLANPEVPIGNYALEVISNIDKAFGNQFAEQVLANLVSEESNVRQVAFKVELGEADIGIVYTTDIRTLSNVRTIAIPDELNVTTSYAVALIDDSRQTELALTFINYLHSDSARAVLKDHGFIIPSQ